jgi:hypothetical protein
MVPPVVGGLDLFHILPRRPIETETALEKLSGSCVAGAAAPGILEITYW